MKQGGRVGLPIFNPLEAIGSLHRLRRPLYLRQPAYLAYTGLEAPPVGSSALEHVTVEDLSQVMTSLGSIPHAHSPEARLLRGLGEALGLYIIVQSMESEAQMGFLLAEGFGFTLGQGRLLGRSAAALDAEIFLGRGKSNCG